MPGDHYMPWNHHIKHEQRESHRQESRIDYGTTDENMTLEQIQTGAILRIADAAEKMANNYAQILSDLDWYKKRYQQEKDKMNNSGNLWPVTKAT